jgi:cobalt-zinc-cadmium resistance protein CzcA
MINKIISYSIKNKFMVSLMLFTLIGAGFYSLKTINLDSVPDITNNQVQVITVSQNLSTVDIEQFVTYPVELAMANLPGVIELRSVSRFGLSVVTIVFKDNMGTYLPRQVVQEKLNAVKDEIPAQFGEPFMGPITTGLGEIFQYTIKPKPGYDTIYSPTELRTIQDWIVKRQMALIPGVVEVNSFGGNIKQYEIALNPDKLNAMSVSITEVFEALENNNVNTGGAYIEKNHMANFIRGEGLARSLDDIKNIVVKNENGIPGTLWRFYPGRARSRRGNDFDVKRRKLERSDTKRKSPDSRSAKNFARRFGNSAFSRPFRFNSADDKHSQQKPDGRSPYRHICTGYFVGKFTRRAGYSISYPTVTTVCFYFNEGL